jgi:7-cyano-7-deazaguanine synthase
MEYVPFRNTILISLAVAWAEVLGADLAVIGSIGGPWITPDNNPRYFEAMNRLVEAGSRASVVVAAPLNAMTKARVLLLGRELGIDLALTWSCQNEVDNPCQECNNCRDRSAAFAAANLVDPLFEG